jgi:hypothetical protein
MTLVSSTPMAGATLGATAAATRRGPNMRMMMLVVAALLAGCSGGSGTNSETVNPCVSKGATYLGSFTEVSGTCAPIDTTIVSVSPNGTITTGPTITCASQKNSEMPNTGCTVQSNDCTWTAAGVNYTGSSSLTWAPDGSWAMGQWSVMTTEVHDPCSGTYEITITRETPDGG